MRRRDFIVAALSSAAAAWPLTARAQQPTGLRRVGVVLGLAENDPEAKARIKAFRHGMRDLEWIEGRNVQVEYRFAGSHLESIKQHVAELVRLAPDVIVANTTPVLVAVRAATSTIPIVFVLVNDPVGQGFIPSLARPGSNITGFSLMEPEIVGKWINLLADVKPNLSRVALMFNPDTAPYYDDYLRSFQAFPQRTSVPIEAAHVQSVADVDLAVATLGRDPASGLMVGGEPFVLSVRGAILKAAERRRVPIISPYRQFVAEGSLMSYGPDTVDIFRRSTSYVDRILKGVKPADLPVQAPTKYELVINLKIAKSLGLTVSQTLQVRADEVIE